MDSKLFSALVGLAPYLGRWVVLPAAGVSAAWLFLSDGAITRLGLAAVREEYRPYAGAVLLFTGAVLGVWAARAVWRRAVVWRRRRREQSRAFDYLTRLDDHERAVLREFWLQQRNTIDAPVNCAEVVALLNAGILVRTGNLGRRVDSGFEYPVAIASHLGARVPEVWGFPLDMPDVDASAWAIARRPAWAEHNAIKKKLRDAVYRAYAS